MRKRLAALLLLILAAAVSAPAAADNLKLSLSGSSVDNLFQTRYAEPDEVAVLGLSWDKAAGAFTLFADGQSSFFRRNSGLSSFLLSGGADVLHPIGSKTAVYLSLEGAAAIFRQEFSDFDYGAFRFRAALKSYLTPSSILKADAGSEIRSYRYEIFDHFTQSFLVSLDKFFPSRTTLKAEAAWGWKYYFHPGLITPEGGETGIAGGRGRWNWGKGIVPDATVEGRGIQIASVSGLIAQGVGDRLGLRLTGTRQWTLSGENPFEAVEEYYMIENPTFDVYSWSGFGLNAQATLVLPWDAEIKVGYTVSEKTFPGIEGLGLDGTGLGLTRKDDRRQIDVRIEKEFRRLAVFFSFSGVDNASNDPLFEWKGPAFAIGLQWLFSWGERP